MNRFFPLLLLCLFMATAAFAQKKSFTEEEVSIPAATGSLSGTLLKPAGAKKYPVVLIIAGSGPTDRNGNSPMTTNNSLKMLAEALGQKGIASLRYDKRGIGKSQAAIQKEEDQKFEDLAGDAAAWVNFLKKDKRHSQIGIIGHSEGALLGLLAAQQTKPDFYVSLAGVAKSADSLIVEQLQALPEQIQAEAKAVLDKLVKGETVAEVQPYMAALFRPSVQPYLISWFRYHPATEFSKLKIPALVVQGTTDIQVPTAEAERLAKANPKAELVLIPEMNHVLKPAPADRQQNIAVYMNPDLALSPELAPAISDFILKQGKK